MSQIVDVGANIRAAREARGLSRAELAEQAGVSRAMIDRVERGVSSPTTSFLGRLCGSLRTTMSALLSPGTAGTAVQRADDHPTWTDPDSGYVRRQIARMPQFAADVTEVELPAGGEVGYPAESYAFIRQLVWVLHGELTLVEGTTTHVLADGDRLVLGEPVPRTFANRSSSPCRYVVVVAPSQP